MNPRIEVLVDSEEGLADALSEFTAKVFAAIGRPGVDLHPRAFRRAVVNGSRGHLCPSSFPAPAWVSLVIEQVSFDLAGMQPRLLYNDRPWLEQPAIYTDCYQVVAHAKKVADDYLKESKEKGSGEHSGVRSQPHGARSGAQGHRSPGARKR